MLFRRFRCMARSRGGLNHRSPRRRTGWEEGPGFLGAQTFGATASALFAGVELLTDGNTVVRIRGMIELILTSASALGDGFHGAFGIGIVTAQAFGVGISAVPTPVTEVEWEGWLWHQFFSIHAPTAAQVSDNRQVIEIDTKAMRKIGANEVVFLMVEATEVGTSGLIARAGTRMLLKLP